MLWDALRFHHGYATGAETGSQFKIQPATCTGMNKCCASIIKVHNIKALHPTCLDNKQERHLTTFHIIIECIYQPQSKLHTEKAKENRIEIYKYFVPCKFC